MKKLKRLGKLIGALYTLGLVANGYIEVVSNWDDFINMQNRVYLMVGLVVWVVIYHYTKEEKA